jgi:predicted DCC family thiol-disulfide oxidoreductase YuxK
MDTAALLVLYDGDCAYCNGWVNWIRRRDTAGRFRYAALASPEGTALREQHRIPAHLDTVVLVEKDRAHVKSDAAWRILALLPGMAAGAWALRIIPRPLRDLGYDLVARNRHRLGMRDACELPDRH